MTEVGDSSLKFSGSESLSKMETSGPVSGSLPEVGSPLSLEETCRGSGLIVDVSRTIRANFYRFRVWPKNRMSPG